jgi:hypothetical protein
MIKGKDGKLLSRSEGEAVMKGRGAITITIYALVLSIVSIFGNGNSSAVLNDTLEINDTWAFYQAKSIKQTIAQFAADSIGTSLAEREFKPELEASLKARQAKLMSDVARYESDTKSNDGKKELIEKARSLDAERMIMKKRGLYFSISGGLLQIGIVLSSTAILAVSMSMLWASVGVSLLGVACFANAFIGLL